jgi:hypothetical protein
MKQPFGDCLNKLVAVEVRYGPLLINSEKVNSEVLAHRTIQGVPEEVYGVLTAR